MTTRFNRAAIFQTGVVVAGWALLLYWLTSLPGGYAVLGIFFALFAGLVEYVDVALPEGSSISAVSAIGIAAILVFPLPIAAVSTAVGVGAARLFKERKVDFAEVLYGVGERGLVISLAGLFMGGHVFVSAGGSAPGLLSLEALQVVGVCVAYFFVEVALHQARFSLDRSAPFWPLFIGGLRLLGPIYAALASIGVLMALMYPSMGVWSAVLFIVLLLVTRQSFSLYLDIRRTYRSTIAALAAAVEAESPERQGHGERVATLSVRIARELRLHSGQLEWIGYAALLHDVGRLGMDEDSFDGLMESVNAQSGEVQHAITGAEIIGQVEFLKPAVEMVRYHHRPHVGGRRSRSDDDALGSQIIGVASYYDELTQSRPEPERLRSREALAQVKKEQSMRFDPRVVRALGDVVAKTSRLEG